MTTIGSQVLTLGPGSITTSGDFTAKLFCGTSVAPGASCPIVVTFTPATTGSEAGSLIVIDNAVSATQMVPLSGTGVAPSVVLSSTSLSFSSQVVGVASIPTSVTLTNSGTAPLTINSITLRGANPSDSSTTTNCPTPLAAGSACSIQVSFKPTATGNRSATLTITDDAPNSPQTVSLSGGGNSFVITPRRRRR